MKLLLNKGLPLSAAALLHDAGINIVESKVCDRFAFTRLIAKCLSVS
ncbi:hypothetical protein KBT16_02650 [Nostoc sp. CCCryo 231-06]|nr:hypothetical protein [Nostoc sp. CCCryo 231-06]